MDKNTQNNLLVAKMAELIKKAPSDWAARIALKMGKGEGSIYYYSRCERGVRKGYPQQVLKHLKKMVNKIENKNQKLIS